MAAQENLRAVIVTALPVEFKAVREFLYNSQKVRHKLGNIYEQGIFATHDRVWEVGLAQIGAGNPGAALQTERAIEFFDPQVILFVGVAGGIKDKDVGIGDVVASTKIYDYEFGKAEEELFKPRPTIGLGSFSLRHEAEAEARSDDPEWLKRLPDCPESPPKAWVGPIAAGEKVVASTKSSVYEFLRHNYGDALAVEMEGYGFLQAVQERQTPVTAIVVRGISDLIDNKNDDQNQEPEDIRQEKASRHASAFAFQLLANFNPNVGLVSNQPAPRQVDPQIWSRLFSCFQADDLDSIAPLFEQLLTPEQRDYYQQQLTDLTSLQELQDVLEQMDDLGKAVEWVGQIICAFEYPTEGDTRPVPSALQAWYDERKPFETEPEPPKKSPGYLLISLEPQDDEDEVRFMAELHTPNGEVSTISLPDAKCSVDEPSKYLSEAINRAGKDIKTVEFFLSWRHFCKPVHEWKVTRGMGRPQPLQWVRNTVVRSLDRLMYEDLVDEWLDSLSTRWQCLQDAADLQLDCRCHEVIALDFDALGSDLVQQSQYLMLKLLAVLPEDPDERQDLFSILLESGIPIWFWPYSSPPNPQEFSELIESLLTIDNLREPAVLAAAVKEDRARLSTLGLLCECPTRFPVLVDWKNGRMRPPESDSAA